MKNKTKKIILKETYDKERKRILNYLSDMRSRGYIQIGNVLPDIPKNITAASVNRLKKLSPRKIRENLIFINENTGEFVRGTNTVGVKRIRQEMKQEAYETGQGEVYQIEEEWDDPSYVKAVNRIQKFIEEVNRLNVPKAEKRVRAWLKDWIDRDGIDIVSEDLERAARKGLALRVNENYPDGLNRSREVKFFAETMSLNPGYYGSDIVDELEMSIIDDYFLLDE